ncbi:MAG: hypothetical protein ACLP1Y_17055 [Candidatus Acidiferrales bacterium]
MIERKKDGKTETLRPTFVWTGDSSFVDCTGQLTEDIRNNLEQLNRSQMLQCDVRGDIARMRVALEKIAKKLTKRRARR